MRIALATEARLPELDPDSRLLLPVLDAMGVEAQVVIWNDSAIDWSRFDAVLIRSTWDYHDKLPAFLAWAKAVSRQTRLYNSLSVVQWNSNKRYLRDLEAQGVPVVETTWLTSGDWERLGEVLAEQGWDDAVIKPAVSAAGKYTVRFKPDNLPSLAADTELDSLWLVQPYLSTIETRGEVSLVFAGGRFSHGVIKYPASADFRVQEHFGGRTLPYAPDGEEIRWAEKVLSHIVESVLYARVDFVFNAEGERLLSELELIEPSFYLAYASPEQVKDVANLLVEGIRAASSV